MGHAQLIVHNAGQTGSEDEWGENTRTTVEITHVFTQIISENISLSHGIIFQAPEPFKMPYPKKPWDVNTPYGANPYQRIISRQVEIR